MLRPLAKFITLIINTFLVCYVEKSAIAGYVLQIENNRLKIINSQQLTAKNKTTIHYLMILYFYDIRVIFYLKRYFYPDNNKKIIGKYFFKSLILRKIIFVLNKM